MTPERLAFLVDRCRQRRRRRSLSADYRDIAAFLEVEPITLRRWLVGARPIPRAVELVFEILHCLPEATLAELERLIPKATASNQ
jgi:hypothetical protein